MDTTNIIHIQTTDYNNDILEEEHNYTTLTMPLHLLYHTILYKYNIIIIMIPYMKEYNQIREI